MKKRSNLGLAARFGILTFVLLAFTGFSSVNAQITIDGHNCVNGSPTEWPDSLASVDVGDPNGIPASGDYNRMWFEIYEDTIAFAFTRASSTTGNSAFSLFFDTDCDSTSGNTTWGGAEVAMFFNIGSGYIISNTSVWGYSGGSWSMVNGNAFYGFLGDSTCGATDFNFFEFAINVNELVDVCNIGGLGSCNGMTLTWAISNAGGSFGSAAKDVFEIDRFVFINEPPVPVIDKTNVCNGVATDFSAANSLENSTTPTDYDEIVAYAWDFNNDGTTDGTGVTETWTYLADGVYPVTLEVTDNFGCSADTTVSVTVQSVDAGIDVFISDSAGLLCPYWEWTSVYTGTTNAVDLSYFVWDMPDGFKDTTNNLDSTYAYVFNTACYWDLNGDPLGDFVVTAYDSLGCSDVAGITFVPVELVYFLGDVVDGAAHIKWQTATEINSDHFVVEKSLDGRHFVPFQRVQAAGNSVHLNDYMVIDPNMEEGNVYYRLTQYDFDGTFEVFRPIILNKKDREGRISVSPNPGDNVIRVDLPETRYGGMIEVMDMTGRVLIQNEVAPAKGMSSVELNVSDLPEGMYYVRFGNEKEGYTSQLVQLI